MTRAPLFHIALFAVLVAGAAASSACGDDENYVQLYHTEPYAPSLNEAAIANMEHLGPVIVGEGTNFSVYSERATRIEVLLFDDPEADRPTRRIPMTRFGDVWSVYVEGVGRGQYYGYIAFGPNWVYDETFTPGTTIGFQQDVDEMGNRFNPNKLLLDPYATAIHRDHDWMRGSLASGPDRHVSTWGAGAKNIIVESQYTWSEGEAAWQENRKSADWAGHRWKDMILYEVHPKGFTASPASGVQHPGTFRGIGGHADYLADLGITAVELLPIMEKPLDGTYWGYNNLNYFTAEVSLSSEKDDAEVIDEFKWMVDQLHQRDIEVILDVVYNHTGEGGFWRSKIAQDDFDPGFNPELINYDAKEVASIYSFRGLDNAAYYLLSPDNKEFYFDQTGVGNQCRANHRPMRQMIMDSLHYWVEEMHVDGFRFDLAAVLGARDEDPKQWSGTETILQEIIDDPLFQERNIRMIAEPWALGHYVVGQFPVSSTNPAYGWAEWNGNYRDIWRSLVNDDGYMVSRGEGPVDVGGSLTGSYGLYGGSGRKPWHSVNFVTAHDGFTLYDLVSYNEKSNLCSPLNPICCSEPTNPFCDPDSGEDNNRSRNWEDEDTKRQMMRNLFMGMVISHGSPMLLGGDEWMRTQLGNNNAYSTSSDNPANWFQWGEWQADENRVRMHDFVRKALALRKQLAYAFAPATYEEGGGAFAWKDANNADLQNWEQRNLMQHYHSVGDNPEVVVLLNMEATSEVTFTLPEGRAWLRLVDTQAYFDQQVWFDAGNAPTISHNITLEDPEAVTASYTAKPRTIVVLVEAK